MRQGVRASGRQGVRDTIVDSFRGLAIFLVILGHVAEGFGTSGISSKSINIIHDYIYSFHMPLFFMISGYVHGMKSHSSNNYLSYVRKDAINLYLPCIYFSLLYWSAKFFFVSAGNQENFRPISVNELYEIPFLGGYWFLCALFFLKAVHLFFECKVKNKILHSAFWVVLFLIIKFSGLKFPEFISRFAYGFYFYVGYVIKHSNYISANNHPKFLWGAILILAGMIILIYPHYRYRYSSISALFTSLGLFIIFYALKINNTFMSFCGAHTLVFYVIHSGPLACMRLLFRFTGAFETVAPIILFFMSFVTSVAFLSFFILLYENVKIFRWVEYIFYPGKFFASFNKNSAKKFF